VHFGTLLRDPPKPAIFQGERKKNNKTKNKQARGFYFHIFGICWGFLGFWGGCFLLFLGWYAACTIYDGCVVAFSLVR